MTLTLNRPHRKNAIDSVMWEELRTTLREISANPQDRALVITGADGAFCSGQDLGDSSGRPPYFAMKQVADVAISLHRMAKPVIAKVDGIAAGAGLNLALGCDLIVASDRSRFSEIFVRRGLTIDFGGSWLLPRLIGLHRAKQLALLGDVISAAEAAELGLVNRVVPVDELDAAVEDWAARLVAGPPIALGSAKELLNQSFDMTFEQALDAEGLAQAVNFGTADTREAISAFLDKREPRFEGR